MTEIYSFAFASIGTLILTVVFKPAIEKLLEKHYSNLSKAQVTRSVYLLFAVAFTLLFGIGEVGAGFVEAKEPEKIEERPVTTAEVIVGQIDKRADQIIDHNAQKKAQRDSLIANREKKWVYQIGSPMPKKEAMKLYNGLKSIEGMCLFKEGRKSYRVILYEANSTEAGLKTNLSFLQEKLASLNEDISVVDLTSFCSRKETLSKVESIESESGHIRCYECIRE